MAAMVCEVSIGLCMACGCHNCAMLVCVYSIGSMRYITYGHVCGVYAVLVCLCSTCGEKLTWNACSSPSIQKRGREAT